MCVSQSSISIIKSEVGVISEVSINTVITPPFGNEYIFLDISTFIYFELLTSLKTI